MYPREAVDTVNRTLRSKGVHGSRGRTRSIKPRLLLRHPT